MIFPVWNVYIQTMRYHERRVADVAHLHKALGSLSNTTKITGKVMHICNISAWEVEAEEVEIQRYSLANTVNSRPVCANL